MPQPQSLVVIAPWADLACTGESYSSRQDSDYMLTTYKQKWAAELAVGGYQMIYKNNIDLRTATYSAVYGTFDQFTNLLLIVGTDDIQYSDSITVYNKAKKSNVNVELIIGENMFHDYPLFYSYVTESDHGMNQIRNSSRPDQ